MAKAKVASDHVPNPTDIGGTLDTSGTSQGGDYDSIEKLHDVFDPAHTDEADQLAADRAVETDEAAATDYTLTGKSPDTTGGGAQGSVHKGTGSKKAAKRAPAKKAAAKKTGAAKRAAKKAPAKKATVKKAAPAKRATKKAAPAAKTGSQRRAAKKAG